VKQLTVIMTLSLGKIAFYLCLMTISCVWNRQTDEQTDGQDS